MSAPPTSRPRSLVQRILDSIFLLAGLVFAGVLLLPWLPLDEVRAIIFVRIALAGSFLLLGWALFRLIQARSLAIAGALILLALLPQACWPLLTMLEVRQAARVHDIRRLCQVVDSIDRIGSLALTARPARTLALECLRQLVAQDQEGPALAAVVCDILRTGGDDADLADIKHTAAARLAALARASPDPYLLSVFASEVRQGVWEDDADCRSLLTIWRERTENVCF